MAIKTESNSYTVIFAIYNGGNRRCVARWYRRQRMLAISATIKKFRKETEYPLRLMGRKSTRRWSSEEVK